MPDPPRLSARGRLAAGAVGWLTLVAIGWSGLLLPSLIRSIEATFHQTDAGIGVAYLAIALAYGTGSLGGGALTERLGRRVVLGGAACLHGVGVVGLGLAPSWPGFLLAAAVMGLGAGCLDGGANGLVLDVYREGRGRAMNLLHVAFGLGALSAPLVIGAAVSADVAWQAVAVTSGLVVALLAIAYLLVPMPSGRHRRPGTAADARDPEASPDGVGVLRLLAGPLLWLGLAIAAYVASEVGVSNWLVRFLEPAPLATATLALSLYWLGLTVGRLVSAAIADRFDHATFTLVCVLAMALLIAAAVLVPSLPLSIVAFAAAGVASGPVFPMIVALGGDRYPDRSAAVGGLLTGMAVVGSTLYPPAMGFLSVTLGLTVAMLGTVSLAIACALALLIFGRQARTVASGS